MAQDTIPCEFKRCDQRHPIRTARDKAQTPFYRCDNYGGSTVFLRGPIGSQILGNLNGGYTRENPMQVIETEGAGDDGHGPDEDVGNPNPWVDAQPNPAVPRIPVYGRCENCGRMILVPGMPDCDACHTPISWE